MVPPHEPDDLLQPPMTTLFDAYDQLLDGQLEALILGCRKAGLTHVDIHGILRGRNVNVSRATAGRWIMDIDAATKAEAEAKVKVDA